MRGWTAFALDGGNLGNGIHGILVAKPDYCTTEDSPLIERSKVFRFTGDGVRLDLGSGVTESGANVLL